MSKDLHPNDEIIIVGFAKKIYEGLKQFENQRIIDALEENTDVVENLVDRALEMMLVLAEENEEDIERLKYLHSVTSLLQDNFL